MLLELEHLGEGWEECHECVPSVPLSFPCASRVQALSSEKKNGEVLKCYCASEPPGELLKTQFWVLRTVFLISDKLPGDADVETTHVESTVWGNSSASSRGSSYKRAVLRGRSVGALVQVAISVCEGACTCFSY